MAQLHAEVSDELMKRVKLKCLNEGCTIKEAVRLLLEKWVEGEIDFSSPPAPAHKLLTVDSSSSTRSDSSIIQEFRKRRPPIIEED